MGKTELSKYFAEIGSRGGKKTAARMTKQQRVERARAAALAKAAKATRGTK
jgi:hypothetical protein